MYTRSLGMAQSTHEFVPVVSQPTSLTGNQPVAQIPVLAQSNNAFPVGIPANQSFPTMIPQFVPSLIQPLQPHAYPISGVLPPNYAAQLICDVRRSPYAQQYNDLSSAVNNSTTVAIEIAGKYSLEKDTLDSLIQQLEFYMSPVNLPTDVYLLKQMDVMQHVPISCFSNFPKVKELLPQLALEERTEVITSLLKTSPMVQLNREETKVRVNKDMVVFMDTLELRGLPENVQHPEMKSLFPTSESLEFNVEDDVWVVSFKDSSEASEKYRSITNKTLKFRQNILYVRFKTKGRNPSMDETQIAGLFYVKFSSDWSSDSVQPAVLQRHQLYQPTPSSSALFPGQQPQQQLAAYNLHQQQQCLRHYLISPLIFPTNIMPTYILPQHPGIINLQHHPHQTLNHPVPQSLSVAPPSVALAAPSLSSPQGQAQFVATMHQGGSIIHHQQQQPHHQQHPSAAGYSGNNGSISAASRGNGHRRPPRGGRRGGQSQRSRLPQHAPPHEETSEFKLPHPSSEVGSTIVHATQK